jgi:hypothetical protein
MSQISPPIRILLVCAVAFLAAWMLFLRPSTDAGTPAAEAPPTTETTPPVEAGGEQADSLAGKAVEAANEATAQQDARAEQLAGGAGETAADPAAGSAAAPATATAAAKTGAPTDVALPTKEALATVPADVRRAIVKRKIIVLGVVAPKGADDRLVRKSLGKVDKLHGRVFVKTVPVKRISRYGTITRGIDVSQTPSVVVVDFELRATTLAGWSDVATIDQAVVDAIRYSGTLYTDPYLKQVAQSCTRSFPDLHLVLEPTSPGEARRLIGRFGGQVTLLKSDIAAISTPEKWRGFSRATRADLVTLATALTGWQAAFSRSYTLANLKTTLATYGPRVDGAVKRLNKRFDAHDVVACGSKG